MRERSSKRISDRAPSPLQGASWCSIRTRPGRRPMRLPSERKRPSRPRIISLVVAALFVTAGATPASAQAPGYVKVRLLKAGLMLGAGGGSGVLTYRGRNYPFTVSGLSLGVTAGASVNRLEGWASGIKQVSDFAGTYSSVGAGGALVGGFGGVHLGNEKGVTIEDRKSTRLNSSHSSISYAVFCLKKKINQMRI